MSLPTILDALSACGYGTGTMRDDEFMADMSRVVNETAPKSAEHLKLGFAGIQAAGAEEEDAGGDDY